MRDPVATALWLLYGRAAECRLQEIDFGSGDSTLLSEARASPSTFGEIRVPQ